MLFLFMLGILFNRVTPFKVAQQWNLAQDPQRPARERKFWATSKNKNNEFPFYLASFESDPTVRIIYKGIKQQFKWQMYLSN